MKKTLLPLWITLFFLSTYDSSHASGKYHPPLDPPLIVTGTFGEFRSTHFHGGIDFSTQRRTGKKVYAAEEGYISRLKVAPNGYGKAVYIKLIDGNTAVYGHLSRFSKIIEERVLKEQKKRSSSFVDFYLTSGEIKVKRGEIIAYSGDSGGVPPHLHFEIRDPEEKLINPLNDRYAIPDKTRPKIKSVALVPLSSKNIPLEKKYWKILTPNWDPELKKYVLPPQNIPYPHTGIELSIIDESHGNKCAPAQVRLAADQKILFERRYNAISFDEFYRHFLVYNRHFWLNQKGIYERLYSLPGSRLPFQKADSNYKGAVVLNPGETRNLDIAVWDAAGNQSLMSLVLIRSGEIRPGGILQSHKATRITPGKTALYQWPDKRLSLSFPKNSVYYPVQFSSQTLSKSQFPKAPYRGPVFELNPKDALLRKEVTLNYFLPEGDQKGRHLYQFNPKKKKWSFLKKQTRWQGEITVPIQELGTYTLLEDVTPPDIKPIQIKTGKNGEKRLCFAVSDNLSGINYRHIVILNEKSLLLFEVNANKREITVPLTEENNFAGGKVHVMVPDYAENHRNLYIDTSRLSRGALKR